MEPLVDVADLNDFPGAPFPDAVILAAQAQVRADAGWHIAPIVTETVVVESNGGGWLQLPSLKVVSIDEVTDDDGNSLAGWKLMPGGRLFIRSGWRSALYEVTMTHGYAEPPADLLPVVAARCQRSLVDAVLTQRSETVGPRTTSEAYNINRLEVEAGTSVLDRYTLPPTF
jgi:hypothetical protein